MSDIKHVLIEDARLAQISDEITFGVTSGANQSTYQQFNAISSSSNSVIYNIIVPSEAIAIDKCVLMNQIINVTVEIANVPVGYPAWSYGAQDSFQAFPFNSLMKTVNATINNTSVSTVVSDVLPALVRMNNKHELDHLRGMCPVMPDSLIGAYENALQYQWSQAIPAVGPFPADPAHVPAYVAEPYMAPVPSVPYTAVTSIASPLTSSYGMSPDCDFVPRGAHPLKYLKVVYGPQGVFLPLPADVTLISQDITDKWIIEFGIETTEPFMCLSPFTSNPHGANCAAMIGINTMSFNINLDSTCSRLLSTAGYSYVADPTDATAYIKKPYITSVKLGTSQSSGNAFTNPRMLLNFLTLQPHQYAHIKSKNILPYYDTPRWISNQNQNVVVKGAYTGGSTTVLPIQDQYDYQGGTADITSSNIQLNIVPDKLIILFRKPQNQQNITDPNAFLAINKISISFSNTSGLLANATAQDLWKMSVKNGSSQSWLEFSGHSNYVNQSQAYHYTTPFMVPSVLPTCGSILVVSPDDLNLPDFLSASSLGQFSLYFTANVTNYLPENITPEICIIAVNSGIMTTIQGQSSLNLGLLTKQTVLDTKQQEPVDRLDTMEYARLIGGSNSGLDNSALSNLRGLARRFKARRQAKMDATGGHMSAGATSGGRSGMAKYM